MRNNAAVAAYDDSSDNNVDVSDPDELPTRRRKLVHFAAADSPSSTAPPPAKKRRRTAKNPLFICSFKCGRVFERLEQRKAHHNYHHPEFFKYYKCKVCDYWSVHSVSISRHLYETHALRLPKWIRDARLAFVVVIKWRNPDRRRYRSIPSTEEIEQYNAQFAQDPSMDFSQNQNCALHSSRDSSQN